MAKFANQTVLNMQNRIITSIFCATLTIAAMAQTETPDSIKTQNLDEIVVEAQMQRTSPTSTTFIPTVKQKNASQNAVDLLRQMAMPQIQINPVSEAVTDNAGGEVAIFINFLEAKYSVVMRLANNPVQTQL
ncbi:MAG TPA: hypothetical protein DEG90_05835 [Porphyromonadaceae bacterium]|nr:hypothetical protein [Porphyromonadaceae bacterium]